ncbi:hypothetical protein BD413DRAFT_491970 [Trametes elegans]|nr:hypothetical protein BD413DRAFT_491970 [Trametes elegans]
MVEPAALEFDKIGRLDRTGPDGTYFVAPHPSAARCVDVEDGPHAPFGPPDSAHAYLNALVEASHRRHGVGAEWNMLQLFVGALPDAPFTLGHPDNNSQNIFVDDAGRGPRPLGALAYPSWLTLDWDPIMYDGHKARAHQDTEDDLRRYRQVYVDAVGAAAMEAAAAVTRNSHVLSALRMAISDEIVTYSILFHLGKYVFSSEMLTFRAMEAIEHSGWLLAVWQREPDVTHAGTPGLDDGASDASEVQGHSEGVSGVVENAREEKPAV